MDDRATSSSPLLSSAPVQHQASTSVVLHTSPGGLALCADVHHFSRCRRSGVRQWQCLLLWAHCEHTISAVSKAESKHVTMKRGSMRER